MYCLKCQLEIDEASYCGLHPACFTEWFNCPISTEFLSLQRRSSVTSDQNTNLTPQNTSFFHGKFKKYSADLNGESYILKMRQKEAPELPEVEYLCNQIGKILEVPVADFYFIDFNGDKVFVTKNFIKNGAPIDLQHIYHFRSDDQHNCETLAKLIAQKTQRPHDVLIFIRTILFDALIGNHDRHGRNLAFIVNAKNIVLSPIYDNVSYLSLEEGQMLKADFNPTGKISTSETREPNMRSYVKELKKLGYNEEVQAFYQIINLNTVFQMIDKSYCSELMKSALKKLINKRFKELEDELAY